MSQDTAVSALRLPSLANALEAKARVLAAVVLIDAPDEIAAARIMSRGQGREDDRAETVRERLRVYHEPTEPLIAHYEEHGVLARIDGTRTPEAVNSAIHEALEAVAATP